jgi:hypothetical protein
VGAGATLARGMNGHNGNGKHPPLTARELREQARQLSRRADELRTEAGYLIMQAVRLESVYRALEAELDVAMAAAVKEVGDPLTPRTWCRCALALVKDWAVEEHDLGYLELVLTYFIAMGTHRARTSPTCWRATSTT